MPMDALFLSAVLAAWAVSAPAQSLVAESHCDTLPGSCHALTWDDTYPVMCHALASTLLALVRLGRARGIRRMFP